MSGATTPTYDANGDMTGDQNGNTFVYDAWNRLVAAVVLALKRAVALGQLKAVRSLCI